MPQPPDTLLPHVDDWFDWTDSDDELLTEVFVMTTGPITEDLLKEQMDAINDDEVRAQARATSPA